MERVAPASGATEENEASAHVPIGEPSPEPEDEIDPRELVRRLHSQGLSSELIANRTGVAIGEVELIISLGANRTRT